MENKNKIILGFYKGNTENNLRFCSALIILPIISALIALSFGRYFIPIGNILSCFMGKDIGGVAKSIIWDIRVPRVILAMLVGAGLSVSGLMMQALFANPLATPDTIGVGSGASFGAVIAILFNASILMVECTSILFGLVAITITFFIARNDEMNLSFVILAGIMVSAIFSSLVSLVKYVANPDFKLPEITFWLMGSLASSGYKNLVVTAPLIIISLVIAYLFRWRLNLLSLSEDDLNTSGINVKLFRIIVMVLSTILSASVVAMCGQVGFVALIVPHFCKMLFGDDNILLVPASISIGATFMIIVDTIARSISSNEIPISILTSLIGAPFFIYIIKGTSNK